MALADRRTVLTGLAASTLAGRLSAVAHAEGATMLKRAIPHSGELLPVIGLGTARVFNFGDDATQREAARQVVNLLVEGDGSLIDTASSYGASEAVVGAVATGTPLREKIFVATKLEERGGQGAREEFATSLKRLGVKKVDLIQLHNVHAEDSGFAFYRDLKAEGLTRYHGVTTTFPEDYAAMEAFIKKEKPDFIEVDCSIANRVTEERIIPAAADVGSAVLIAVPLGKAELFRTVKGKPLPPVAKDIGAATWGQVFLKYLVGNPAITAVIPATNNPKHMADNLAAGHGPVPDAKQRQALVTYFEGLG